MHPQEFAEAGTANPAPAPTSQGRERPHDENGLERQRRGRTIRPRILGDYTLSKTLGKGNSGKVKLATHNITGEKVNIGWLSASETHIFCRWRSKFFPGYIPIHPHRQTVPSPAPTTILKRFEHFAKLLFLRFYITLIFVECEKCLFTNTTTTWSLHM